jgi:hypothetical protein
MVIDPFAPEEQAFLGPILGGKGLSSVRPSSRRLVAIVTGILSAEGLVLPVLTTDEDGPSRLVRAVSPAITGQGSGGWGGCPAIVA